MSNLNLKKKIESVFEVGCGSGPNLLIFRNEGLRIGGIDYSEALIKSAKSVLGSDLQECFCDEAINMPTEEKYDSVLSNGVFHYFPSLDYASKVIEKMIDKANYSVGLIDIHDVEKQEDFLAWRRRETKDYDVLYKGLDKQFYSREWMNHVAERNNCEIMFTDSNVEGYWNNEFVFDVYFYKRR